MYVYMFCDEMLSLLVFLMYCVYYVMCVMPVLLRKILDGPRGLASWFPLSLSLYIYIYTCICICIYIVCVKFFIHISVYNICVHTYIYIYIHIHTHTHTHTHTCVLNKCCYCLCAYYLLCLLCYVCHAGASSQNPAWSSRLGLFTPSVYIACPVEGGRALKWHLYV